MRESGTGCQGFPDVVILNSASSIRILPRGSRHSPLVRRSKPVIIQVPGLPDPSPDNPVNHAGDLTGSGGEVSQQRPRRGLSSTCSESLNTPHEQSIYQSSPY